MKLIQKYVLTCEDPEICDVEMLEGNIYEVVYENIGFYCRYEEKIVGKLISITDKSLLFDISEKFNSKLVTVHIEKIIECIDLKYND